MENDFQIRHRYFFLVTLQITSISDAKIHMIYCSVIDHESHFKFLGFFILHDQRRQITQYTILY